MANTAPGFAKHPNYTVEMVPLDNHVRVLVGDTVVADSRRALSVTETKHRPVWYLPMADMDKTLLQATETSTYCPFKGTASYWTILTPEPVADAIWAYEEPFDECAALRGYASFYTNKVTLEVDGTVQGADGPGWTDR